MVFIGGYNPIAMLEALINTLIRKGVITQTEAQAIIDAAKAPS